MQFSNIQELKRGYSASYDGFIGLLDKNIENHSDLADNSKAIKDSIKVLMDSSEYFQKIVEKNPELKVGNLINAGMNAKEIYENGGFFSANKGILPAMLKLLERLEKEEKKLLKEKDEKKKAECEKCCCEVLKSIEAERNNLKNKVNDFLKFLETAGAVEIKK